MTEIGLRSLEETVLEKWRDRPDVTAGAALDALDALRGLWAPRLPNKETPAPSRRSGPKPSRPPRAKKVTPKRQGKAPMKRCAVCGVDRGVRAYAHGSNVCNECVAKAERDEEDLL